MDAPSSYGPHKTVYNRFVRWAAKGVWNDVFERLSAEGGPPLKVLLDSSAVKAHRCAGGGKGGIRARPSAARAAAALAAAGGDAAAYREASRALLTTTWPPESPRAPRQRKPVASTPESITESVANG